MSATPLMLYSLEDRGHYPSFVRFLVDGWRDGEGELAVVVSPTGAALQPRRAGVRIVAVDDEEVSTLRSASRRGGLAPLSGILAGHVDSGSLAARHWELVARYAERLATAHTLIVSMEPVWPAVAAGLELPSRFSGIFAAPLQAPRPEQTSPRGRALRLHERIVAERVLAHPGLEALFYLHAASFANVVRGAEKLQRIHAPASSDGASEEDARAWRRRLGIDRDRRVCLLFGHLTERKGVAELADAARHVAPPVARRLALAFVGRLDLDARGAFEAALARLHAETRVQVVGHFDWLAEEDVPAVFAVADVVALPYVLDFGVSNVLVLAAAAAKPVVAAPLGELGATVRDYGLGLLADPRRPVDFGAALEQLLTDPEPYVDRGGMRRLASACTVEAFCRTVYDRLPVGAVR